MPFGGVLVDRAPLGSRLEAASKCGGAGGPSCLLLTSCEQRQSHTVRYDTHGELQQSRCVYADATILSLCVVPSSIVNLTVFSPEAASLMRNRLCYHATSLAIPSSAR